MTNAQKQKRFEAKGWKFQISVINGEGQKEIAAIIVTKGNTKVRGKSFTDVFKQIK